MNRALRLLLVLAWALPFVPAPVLANGTLHAEYFVLPAHHPDVGNGVDDRIVRGLFAARLGPHHVPIVTPFGKSYSGPSGSIHDFNAAGESLWYLPGSTHGVHRVKMADTVLPIDNEHFFPPGKRGNGEGNGYLTVHWNGVFTLAKAQSVGLRLGSDDDSWVYVDGKLVVDNGGVKPLADAPYATAHLSAGTHRLDVFYADRHGSGAAIHLSTAFDVSVPAVQTARGPSIAAQIKKTGRVAVYGIHFAFDRATITRDSDGVLRDVAGVLKADRSLRLRIEGHTDAAGDAAYNRRLSQQRADAVKAHLTAEFGIDAARLTTQGFGPDHPVADNRTAGGRARNRRVELVRI